jgi:hypothetical protein
MPSLTISQIRPVPMVETCSIFDVARCFGEDHRQIRSLVRLVQRKIDELGFPPPILDMAGPRGSEAPGHAVTPRSRWMQAAVLAWFDDSLPPDHAAAASAYAIRDTERTLAARASHLQLVQGGRAAA